MKTPNLLVLFMLISLTFCSCSVSEPKVKTTHVLSTDLQDDMTEYMPE